MTRIVRNERGIALAVAIFALVVVGALVAGAFFAGTQEQRVGENVRRLQQSFALAEAGNYEVLRTWDKMALGPLRRFPNDSMRIGGSYPSGSYSGHLYKLNNRMYLLDVTGTDNFSGAAGSRGGGGRQRIGTLLRIQPFTTDVVIKAGYMTRDNVNLVNVSGGSFIDGNDRIPAAWAGMECDSAGPKAGVIAADPRTLGSAAGRTAGDPPIQIDTTINDSTFIKLGNVLYADLAARANITLAAGTYTPAPAIAAGTCNKTVLTNWGDGRNPSGLCAGYFPIIHLTGASTTISGGQGQGVLLVDGDVNLQNGFEFFGIVIVQGHLNTVAGGPGNLAATIWGGVMTNENELRPGDIKVNFSRCAINQAMSTTGVAAPARSRTWAQLY